MEFSADQEGRSPQGERRGPLGAWRKWSATPKRPSWGSPSPGGGLGEQLVQAGEETSAGRVYVNPDGE